MKIQAWLLNHLREKEGEKKKRHVKDEFDSNPSLHMFTTRLVRILAVVVPYLHTHVTTQIREGFQGELRNLDISCHD